MNATYRRLKKEYDDIEQTILNLYRKQGDIRALMEQACTHVRLVEVQPDPFEEETKFKCKDCYRYFTEDELKGVLDMILLQSDVLKVAKINKATKAKFFTDLSVGDEVRLSIPVKAAGSNGGTYASYITITNLKTNDSVKKSFNELAPFLNIFDFETV